MSLITRRGRAAVAVLAAGGLLFAAACGDNGDATEGEDGEITITLHDFGGAGFGYGDLVDQYMEDNPHVTVDYQTTTDDYDNEYRPNLIQQLDAGTAPDIAAFEEQGVGQMMANPDWWVDLTEYGLDARAADYPDWKYELGVAADGRLAGLGTDVGGMLMCYRSDLFEEAGLPTDRDEVAELFSDWNGFVDAAQQFLDSGVDAPFVDSVNQIYNIRLVQEAGLGDGTSYFDRDDNYVAADSPAVQTAFNFAADLIEMGAVGEFDNWSDEWFQGMSAGGYATMGCPGWMLGVIADNAGEEAEGSWDAAQVPGVAGNWGGSWIGVTKDSDHPEEAAQLVDYLTSPESQLAVFQDLGNYPSSQDAQDNPEVAETTNAYFNEAPTGQMLTASIEAYEPVHFGALHSAARAQMEDVLVALVQGNFSSADEAWGAFIDAGQEVVDLGG